MSTKKTTKRRSTSRTEILDAAWDLVTENGASVPLARISEAAGVSRQCLYLHFRSRGGMLMALVRRADERFEIRERLFAAFETTNPYERLDRVVDVWLDFVIKIHPVASDLVRLRATDPDAAAAWEDRMSDLRSWLVVLTRSLQEDGALSEEWKVKEASEFLWALFSVQTWGLLTEDVGWSRRRARAVLQRSAQRSLLLVRPAEKEGRR